MQRFFAKRKTELTGVVSVALCLIGLSGCDVPIDAFEPNRVLAKRLELGEKINLEPASDDVRAILVELFGSPDEPLWPAFLTADPSLAKLVSPARLRRAAGAVRSDEVGEHYGLYREHCILCHGVAGNGLGATSRLLNPYPRDFRLGKFKFKSTPAGSRPTRADLSRILNAGIAGTSMPAFHLLPEDDIQALVDYVIYLAIRGEVERALLLRAAYDLDLDDGQRLVDFELRQTDSAEFQSQWQEVQVVVAKIAANWATAEEKQLANVAPPADFPIVGDELVDDAAQQRLTASISRGRELFQGKVANCASCHGLEGAGDGVVNDYDDWTKDWTTSIGLDPSDKQQLKPLLELGALKPRHILPRNLQTGVFRGGSLPQDLYTRIVRGIEGTPMPAAPLQPEIATGLSQQDVWDLVNYLLSLSNNVARLAESSVSFESSLRPQSKVRIAQLIQAGSRLGESSDVGSSDVGLLSQGATHVNH
jgi:mono/diheme cytochrome c family protein